MPKTHPKPRSQHTTLMHVISETAIASALTDGVRAPSYWTNNADIAAYYVLNYRDEGIVAAVITVLLETLDPTTLMPDFPSIYEPITTALHKSERQVMAAWTRSRGGDWKDSLRIVGSLQVNAIVPPASLTLMNRTLRRTIHHTYRFDPCENVVPFLAITDDTGNWSVDYDFRSRRLPDVHRTISHELNNQPPSTQPSPASEQP